MGRPWMKFYPADWRGDPRLRLCSLAARGLWIDLMSYMHEGEPYGYLTIDGAQPDRHGIAALVGRPLPEVRKALSELEARRVFSRAPNGALYSRRMVRDKARAEQDAANGRTGGNPRLSGAVRAGVNPGHGAQSPDSRIQNSRIENSRSENPEARNPKAMTHSAPRCARRRARIKKSVRHGGPPRPGRISR